MIYADNAATTKLDREVVDAMIPFLTEEYGNVSQSYSFSNVGKKAIKEARQAIAQCINADPEEIYFTSGGTESDNWAIKMGCHVYGGDVVTSEIEHHAVLHACNAIKCDGVKVKYLSVNEYGVVKLNDANELIDENTGLVSVMLANNEVGSIQPIQELVEIAHEKGALFHTDAVQAVGHIPIDVKALGIDLLSVSAHKFYGPKGIGFLYIKKGINIKPFMDGGMQEKGLRAGTENVASIVGMSVALHNNCMIIDKTSDFLCTCEKIILKELERVNADYVLNGNENKIPGNISLSFRGYEGEMILHRMDLMGISISTGSACNSANTQVSHVIKAIKVPDDYAVGTIRISLGKNNTEEEATSIARSLTKIIGK